MIPVLLAIDKMVLIKYIGDMAQWSVYLTIGNLSHEIRRLWIRAGGEMVGLIPIYKRDSFEVKIEIYYHTIRVITKCKLKLNIMFCIK